jgi:hypothetical protein
MVFLEDAILQFLRGELLLVEEFAMNNPGTQAYKILHSCSTVVKILMIQQ